MIHTGLRTLAVTAKTKRAEDRHLEETVAAAVAATTTTLLGKDRDANRAGQTWLRHRKRKERISI